MVGSVLKQPFIINYNVIEELIFPVLVMRATRK